jgi:hypothetical protein
VAETETTLLELITKQQLRAPGGNLSMAQEPKLGIDLDEGNYQVPSLLSGRMVRKSEMYIINRPHATQIT